MSEARTPSFGWQVAGLAWKHTWAIFGHRISGGITTVLSLVIGSIVFWHLFGWSEVRSQWWQFAAFVVCPGILGFAATFLWHLFLAPAELVCKAIEDGKLTPAIHTKKDHPVDWRPWKLREKYAIFEFAAIMAKRDPSDLYAFPLKMQGYIKLLVEQAKSGNIQINSYEDGVWECDQTSTVLRHDAIAWAKRNGFDVSHIE